MRFNYRIYKIKIKDNKIKTTLKEEKLKLGVLSKIEKIKNEFIIKANI